MCALCSPVPLYCAVPPQALRSGALTLSFPAAGLRVFLSPSCSGTEMVLCAFERTYVLQNSVKTFSVT